MVAVTMTLLRDGTANDIYIYIMPFGSRGERANCCVIDVVAVVVHDSDGFEGFCIV